jgi:hypothetical protein
VDTENRLENNKEKRRRNSLLRIFIERAQNLFIFILYLVTIIFLVGGTIINGGMRGRLQGNTQEGGAFPLGRFDRLPFGLDGLFSPEFGVPSYSCADACPSLLPIEICTGRAPSYNNIDRRYIVQRQSPSTFQQKSILMELFYFHMRNLFGQTFFDLWCLSPYIITIRFTRLFSFSLFRFFF